MSFPLDENERDRLAEEILSRLSIRVEVEQPAYGSSPPRLRIALLDGSRELSADWINLSELQPQ